jgi:hypothetical protein
VYISSPFACLYFHLQIQEILSSEHLLFTTQSKSMISLLNTFPVSPQASQNFLRTKPSDPSLAYHIVCQHKLLSKSLSEKLIAMIIKINRRTQTRNLIHALSFPPLKLSIHHLPNILTPFRTSPIILPLASSRHHQNHSHDSVYPQTLSPYSQ